MCLSVSTASRAGSLAHPSCQGQKAEFRIGAATGVSTTAGAGEWDDSRPNKNSSKATPQAAMFRIYQTAIFRVYCSLVTLSVGLTPQALNVPKIIGPKAGVRGPIISGTPLTPRCVHPSLCTPELPCSSDSGSLSNFVTTHCEIE